MTQKLDESARGVYVIAATPFTDDGALDLQSVDTLTDFYLRCGVHGFTLLGMMGEAHKLTAEDYRNRTRENPYELAASEMIEQNSTEYAPFTLVPANDKRLARLKVLETVCERLEGAL